MPVFDVSIVDCLMVDGLLMSILLFLTHLISMHSFAPCELTASRAYTVCVFGVLSMKQISMLSNKSTNSVYQSNESCDCSVQFKSKSVLFSFLCSPFSFVPFKNRTPLHCLFRSLKWFKSTNQPRISLIHLKYNLKFVHTKYHKRFQAKHKHSKSRKTK